MIATVVSTIIAQLQKLYFWPVQIKQSKTKTAHYTNVCTAHSAALFLDVWPDLYLATNALASSLY